MPSGFQVELSLFILPRKEVHHVQHLLLAMLVLYGVFFFVCLFSFFGTSANHQEVNCGKYRFCSFNMNMFVVETRSPILD